MNDRKTAGFFGATTALLLASGAASGQVVDVTGGATLTESMLDSGSFSSPGGTVSFSLTGDTTFNVGAGGMIGVVGDGGPYPGIGYDFNGSTVNLLDGGTFLSSSAVDSIVSNVTLNVLAGGVVGRSFEALAGSVVNVQGGEVVLGFAAFDGATVNISGGTVGDYFSAMSGSTVNLLVSELTIGGESIEMAGGESMEISARDGARLEAVLADGSVLDFDLYASYDNTQSSDLFAADASLNVTFVETSMPTPGSAALIGLAGLIGSRRRRG